VSDCTHPSFASARADQAERLAEAIEAVAAAVAERSRAGLLSRPGPVFVAIGASLAAACAPAWVLRSRGIHSWRLDAGDHPLPFPATVHPLIGVSQSGRSAETLAVLESVPASLRYAVVNANPSPIADIATMVIDTGNIPDSYASTVGYTSTVAALGMIADGWDGGTVVPGWRDLPAEFVAAEQLLTDQVSRLGGIFARVHSADFVGAGPSVGSAEAAALLFREVARLPSTGMGTRQYLHGAMESAGNSAHVLFGDSREPEVAATLAAAGHPVILVTAQPLESCRDLSVVQIPHCPPAQRVILEALVMQILVAAAAAERAVNIDEFVFHHSDTKVPARASGAPDEAAAGAAPA
jgi:glucosamine--fructose-6-phosphate aminotransferase (isomerizing)